MTTSIVKSAFFAADKATVWAFLTDKDKLGEWFFPAQESLNADKEYSLMGKDDDGNPKKMCWGKVQRWNPHDELVYSFTIAPLQGVDSIVTWRLAEAGNGTKLTIEHTGLSAEGEALGLIMHLDTGWDKHLASLRQAVATKHG